MISPGFNERWPRRGACSSVDQASGLAYVFRGYTGREYDEDRISRFDFTSSKWLDDKEFVNVSPSLSVGACCSIMDDNKLVLFGGWEEGVLHNEVYELDLIMMKWIELHTSIQDKNKPLCKNKCGMVPYGNGMVFIFGGYGYQSFGIPLQTGAKYDWDPINPGSGIGWTNEQHLFHLKDRKWIIPKTAGVRPPPCAAFTMNKIDLFRCVLFGGRQVVERVQDLHILNMATWEWSGVILPTDPNQPWPSKRSFHSAVPLYDPRYAPIKTALPESFDWLPYSPPNLFTRTSKDVIKEQQLLILWGMDNDGCPSSDTAWVLYLEMFTWKQIKLPDGYVPRIWHTSDVYYPTPVCCKIMTLGGVTENLFEKPDELINTTNETVLLEYGWYG